MSTPTEKEWDYLFVNPDTKPTHFYSIPADPRITQSNLTLINDLSAAIDINKSRIEEITTEYNYIYAQYRTTETEPLKRTLYNQMLTLSSEKKTLVSTTRKIQTALSSIRKAQHRNNYDLLGTNPDLIPMSNKNNVRFGNIGGTKKRRKKSNKKKSNKKKSNKKKRNNRTYRR